MNSSRISPGPVATDAFSLGLKAGAILGLSTIGCLYWTGLIGLLFTGYALVVLFPVYLVLVASWLSVWLGYDKDATALRPVYKQR